MLHDPMITEADGRVPTTDRRRSPRAEVHAHLVVIWHHDTRTAVRYPLLDISDGGVRIHSATPLPNGMSGTAVKLLPEGRLIHRMCTVSWARPPVDGGPFEIGLKFAG
jgi:hypothetical protein